MSAAVDVIARLTASVLSVAVTPGSVVAEGDTLLVVESMKMQIPVLSPVTGTVAHVRVAPADIVSEGDILAVIDPSQL